MEIFIPEPRDVPRTARAETTLHLILCAMGPVGRASRSVVLAALIAMGACRPGAEPGGGAEYLNDTYGYAVRYPEDLDLQEYSPGYTAIGRADHDGFDAAVELVMETAEGIDFGSFALDRALMACGPDGPETSLQCTAVTRREPFTSSGGVPGEVLYLRHEVTRSGTAEPIETDERGPFYTFDWSAKVADGTVGVLFVRAPVVLSSAQVDTVLVRQVAASLQRIP
jgi:hypothetical protein